eukprot:4886518-Pleurochrysis_carterae.AAC.1
MSALCTTHVATRRTCTATAKRKARAPHIHTHTPQKRHPPPSPAASPADFLHVALREVFVRDSTLKARAIGRGVSNLMNRVCK